jgi:hypothetical protein
VGFNYFGSIVNFLLPEKILEKAFGERKAYETDKAVFCSEAIARLLSDTEFFKEDFRDVVSGSCTPNSLWRVVSAKLGSSDAVSPSITHVDVYGTRRGKEEETISETSVFSLLDLNSITDI